MNRKKDVLMGEVIQTIGREIITSRLLIVQSKRLQLSSLERRSRLHNQPEFVARVEQLRLDVRDAEHHYRTVILTFESPEHSSYWVVAYSRLIEMGNALAAKLQLATRELPPADRYEVASDVEMLEGIVDNWTKLLHTAMAEAVA